MATKITTRVLADDAVTDAKIADVTLTTATQSASDNTTKIATTAYVTTAIANLADSAPSTLNTLNELAAALGDDANYATTTTNAIAGKLPLAGGTMTGTIAGFTSTGIDDNADATAITIDSSERVLIGTDSGDSFNADSMLRLQRAGDRVFMQFKTDADQNSGILFGDVDDDVESSINYEPANKNLVFTTGNNATALTLQSDQTASFANNIALANDKYILMGTDSGDAFNADAKIRIQDSTNAWIQLKAGTGHSAGVLIGDTDDDFVGGFIYNNSTNAFTVSANNVPQLTIDSGGIDVAGTEITVGTNDTRIAENNLRFMSSGASYIDHNTVGQNIFFRTSSSSSLDTTAIKLHSGGVAEFGSHIYPDANVGNDIGSSSLYWRDAFIQDVYTQDLHLSNEDREKGGNDIDGTKGDWTIQEGEENLYIINNKTGKKFKFAMEEVS